MSVTAVVRWSLGLLILLGVACGDDSGGDNMPSGDAGMKDAGPKDSGTTLPRSDARVALPDPIRACDPSDSKACDSGDTCDLLIRITAADPNNPTFSYGCVPAGNERAAGDPCDPNPTNNQPLRLPGLVDDVYRDECGPGLVCAPSRSVRNGFNCQTACSSDPSLSLACSSPTAICFPATGFSEYCREAEGCDVMKQTGCLPGEACFLVWSDDEKRLLSLCSTPLAMPDPNGDATCNPLTCQVGSACMGPVHKPIASWMRADVKCRPLCGGTGKDDVDAGDSDGGVGGGGCSGGSSCQAFGESGLSLSSIPKPPFGQCE